MEIVGMFATRSQAARKAKRDGIKAFAVHRIGNQGFRLVTMGTHPGLDAAIDYAASCDWISHVETQHIDEGRQPGLRLVFVVTCFKEEIPEGELMEGVEIEPITPSLWGDDKEAFEHRRRVTTSAGPRAKSDVESPTKLVWQIADSRSIEGALTKEDRAAIINECVEKGVNKSTAQTQLYKWAKANGK